MTLRSLIDSSRSLGITMRVSTSSRRLAMPSSAWLARRRPSKANGRVTTPMVSAPSERAIRATTGAPPVPVPPPSPAVTKTMSAPLSTSSISSAWSSAALRADLGVGAGAEAAGELAADVELDVGVAHQQGLRVGVDRDELDALEPDLDHPVDGVDATSTDAHDLDDGQVVLRCCHGRCLSLSCPSPARCVGELLDAVGGEARSELENPNPEVEGYSYVNLVVVKNR